MSSIMRLDPSASIAAEIKSLREHISQIAKWNLPSAPDIATFDDKSHREMTRFSYLTELLDGAIKSGMSMHRCYLKDQKMGSAIAWFDQLMPALRETLGLCQIVIAEVELAEVAHLRAENKLESSQIPWGWYQTEEDPFDALPRTWETFKGAFESLQLRIRNSEKSEIFAEI